MPKYLAFLKDGPRGTLFEYTPNKYAYDIVAYYGKRSGPTSVGRKFQCAGCNLDYLNSSTIIISTPQPLRIIKIIKKSRYLFDPYGQDDDREYETHRVLDEGLACSSLTNMLLDDPAIIPHLELYNPDVYCTDLIPKWLKVHRNDYMARKSNKRIITNTENIVLEHFGGYSNSQIAVIVILIILFLLLGVPFIIFILSLGAS